MSGPIATKIIEKLEDALAPSHLKVDNESHMHAGGSGKESHFRVEVVSLKFVDLTPVRRHQLVYQTLQAELDGPVHALAIHAFAPNEWAGRAPPSPDCQGQNNTP